MSRTFHTRSNWRSSNMFFILLHACSYKHRKSFCIWNNNNNYCSQHSTEHMSIYVFLNFIVKEQYRNGTVPNWWRHAIIHTDGNVRVICSLLRSFGPDSCFKNINICQWCRHCYNDVILLINNHIGLSNLSFYNFLYIF